MLSLIIDMLQDPEYIRTTSTGAAVRGKRRASSAPLVVAIGTVKCRYNRI